MISIFAKRAFLNVNAGQEFKYNGQAPKRGHLLRVSSMIRADQIASQIGAQLNPEKGFRKGICIYVKPHVQADMDFKFQGSVNYLDIIDGWGLIPLLEKHTEVNIIACSQQDFTLLKLILPKHKVVFIPQHHCNFEGVVRDSQEIKTIGIIGTEKSFSNIPEGIEAGLLKRGIKLLKYSKFYTRQDIINFYKQIDLQLVWRPYRMRLSNPLKIVNASSFGIPTIALDETVFEEMIGCYAPVKDVEEFLSTLDTFRVLPELYKQYQERCLTRAKDYHIEKVGELYKSL